MDGSETLRGPLTRREMEVLCLLAGELSNREIAQALVIAPGTVKWYNKQIYKKLNVHSREEAVAKAGQVGLLEIHTTKTGYHLPDFQNNLPSEKTLPENEITDSLIRTKLNRPPLPVDLVRRSRLTVWLEQRQVRPLTLVSAPAGYGKSTMISCWLESVDCPTAWLSLDKGDNELGVFLGYFLAAIQAVFLNALPESQALLIVTPLPPVSAIAKVLINELNQIEQPDMRRIVGVGIHYRWKAVVDGETDAVESLTTFYLNEEGLITCEEVFHDPDSFLAAGLAP